ncbi:MAG: molybdopterin-guanine dinucleotide biosynthesis protein MobB [Desulfovibrionaceae bacterium]|nr:molybdopterin-guanine dinucleotide biosynthesis protein MobB [Desulfovibrionaceae bacterium]
MKAVAVVGYSNSGKTTLISRLADCLEGRGLSVAMVKNTSHAQIDRPDTDTALLMKPGRTVAMLSDGEGSGEAMILWGGRRTLDEILPMIRADVVLVEGGRHLGGMPRILTLRPGQDFSASGIPADLAPENIIGAYGTGLVPGVRVYAPEDLDALADTVLREVADLPIEIR